MTALLILFILTVWGKSCFNAQKYCVTQPDGIEVFVGEDVTLPCRFVYPKTKENVSEVTVIWKASGAEYCGGLSEEIYNSRSNSSFLQYEGRIVLVGDPKTQNASIKVINVMTRDTNNYCCRIIITSADGRQTQYQHPIGTHLTVRGEKEIQVEQPPVIIAFPGDTVTLVSRFITKNQNIPLNVTSFELWWNRGERQGCNSLINDNAQIVRTGNILRYKIRHVNSSHRGKYCWKIHTSTSDGRRSVYENNAGTGLLIAERTNRLGIWQPLESVFNKYAVFQCIYTPPQYDDIVWARVLWMVGKSRDDFAYHPNTDLIHPSYQGKTRLVNESTLVLEDFAGPEGTSFFCRVVVQRCGEQSEVIMEEGSGTRLIFDNHDPVPTESSHCRETMLLVAVSAGIKVLILLVVLIVAVAYIKMNDDK